MIFNLAFHIQILKAKCHTKGHGCVICLEKLAVVYDHFGTRADVISGRYPVLLPLTLKLTSKVKCHRSKATVV